MSSAALPDCTSSCHRLACIYLFFLAFVLQGPRLGSSRRSPVRRCPRGASAGFLHRSADGSQRTALCRRLQTPLPVGIGVDVGKADLSGLRRVSHFKPGVWRNFPSSNHPFWTCVSRESSAPNGEKKPALIATTSATSKIIHPPEDISLVSVRSEGALRTPTPHQLPWNQYVRYSTTRSGGVGVSKGFSRAMFSHVLFFPQASTTEDYY